MKFQWLLKFIEISMILIENNNLAPKWWRFFLGYILRYISSVFSSHASLTYSDTHFLDWQICLCRNDHNNVIAQINSIIGATWPPFSTSFWCRACFNDFTIIHFWSKTHSDNQLRPHKTPCLSWKIHSMGIIDQNIRIEWLIQQESVNVCMCVWVKCNYFQLSLIV